MFQLVETNLRRSVFINCDLMGAKFSFPIPVVPNLDRRIWDTISSGNGGLFGEMWHRFATTHCRGGWAITLAGNAGRQLEDLVGTSLAAYLIYRESRPGIAPPDFWVDDETLFSSLRQDAYLYGD